MINPVEMIARRYSALLVLSSVFISLPLGAQSAADGGFPKFANKSPGAGAIECPRQTIPDLPKLRDLQSLLEKQTPVDEIQPRIRSGTWKNLEPIQRDQLARAIKLGSQRPASPVFDLGTTSAAIDKADLLALNKLIKRGVLDRELSNELDLKKSGALQRPWVPPTGSSTVARSFPKSPLDEAAIAIYRATDDRIAPCSNTTPRATDPEPEPPKKRIRIGCGGDCAVVGAGTPNPVAPGGQAAGTPSTNVAASSATKTTAGPSWSAVAFDGRRTRTFNPLGFMEVVRIEYIDDPQRRCTGTMVSDRLVLTAAHCVAGYSVDDMRVRIPNYEPTALNDCLGSLTQKNSVYIQCVAFATRKLSGAVAHSAYDSLSKRNDVAYLQLSEPVSPAATAKIDLKNLPRSTITFAGYGDDGRATGRPSARANALEVGWQQADAIQSQGERIVWLFKRGNGQSATCTGDSGGPVYVGDYDGANDADSHAVFAIVTAGSQTSCDNFYVSQTRLSAAPIKSWLCGQAELRNALVGCLS